MARRLRGRLQEEPPAPSRVEVVEAPAEHVPFEDESFDSVVATLVLCTVEEPGSAAREIARVLKPEGRFLCLEHVRAPDGERVVRW
jgi:ubiquinone/menaquinone biosynthesis C-methylase UbiE